MLLVLINRENRDHFYVEFQFGKHNMYLNDFYRAEFIDNYPSFSIQNGCGRIMMYHWNYFQRIVKKWIRNKIIDNKKIIKFWKNSRKYYMIRYFPIKDINIINYIMDFN